ncbi:MULTISPECIES: DUF4342 domain-containing protein [unclassified Clostridium]|uniref:DUF4342 domain-containing protein n=1 Tax=unclassified Clostridium TaxID=2614128 RepID=UPI0018997C90|nr:MULTISPECIES: DUF4342 domain-containing protein [unclassified Clostridium]MCR1952515.1 DUF4342 domain-containing protein [Clostridium sp. DSM 100503]
MGITLEKVDQVKERTGVSYAEAKYALEVSNGDVLEAIIYIEGIKGIKPDYIEDNPGKEKYETIDELKKWLKDLINKGNVTRIRVSKDGKELVDVPVNAGIAAGVIAIIIPPILAFVVIAAVVTQITIEITKADGSVEVVNKYISKAANEIKDAATDVACMVKDKVSEVKNEKFNKASDNNNEKKQYDKNKQVDENVFTYTVNFEDED